MKNTTGNLKKMSNNTINPKTPKKPMLLLVDDEPSFHRRFVMSFDKWTVKSAYNANEALRLLRQYPMALAVIDLSFDEGATYSGLDLIEGINHEFHDLPMIAMSKFVVANRGGENTLSDLAIQAGAIKFLSKARYSVNEWQKEFEGALTKKQVSESLLY
jgi:ActR/RegA family two-component response regulator